jgi:pantetheine-phosphate adenylyltransferase
MFDELVVAPYDSPSKTLLFSTEERVNMIKEALVGIPNITVQHYKSLTVHYAEEIGASVIVRGLRTVSDFEYELQLAQNYRSQNPDIEMCCLMTSQSYSHLASSMVKEIARLGGDVSDMVPQNVAVKLYAAYGVTPRPRIIKSKSL